MKKIICLLLGTALMAAAGEVPLPGEDGKHAAVTCAPFPDALSAYVWRNWPVVPVDRLASAIGASRADLEGVAAEMGLPVPQPAVSPLWHRKGYITVVRRNWHLLPYEQLLKVVDMTRAELAYSLTEDDFLFVKLGNTKPLCPPITWSAEAAAAGRARRLAIARTLKEEGIVPLAPEEPRFSFVGELSSTADWDNGRLARCGRDKGTPPTFDLRLIFSYFADYGDPLGDDEVGSYPEGLLARLAENGVNAVWLHTVLSTLARDPAYPEFGEGSERRIANLKKLVARAAKYGIKVYLYMNEPRAQNDSFFEKDGRMEARGAKRTHDGLGYARCTSCPETRRWLRDSLKSVFSQVPGLGGVFTITMSENLTNCASRGGKKTCPRCKDRTVVDIVAEVNRTISEGVKAGDPNAEVICWDWGWPMKDRLAIAERLPAGCRVMTVSERGVPTDRGGVKSAINEYSLSAPGPSDAARELWTAAKGRGLKTAAKVQAALTWEMSAVPYVPVMDLVAEHVRNLAESGVDGVMLSWSLGSAPTPNLSIFADYRKGEGTGPVLDRLAERLYGKGGVSGARAAWKAYSDGFREYPFYISTVYAGNHTMGPANPLYLEPTGWTASMVGIPYDDLARWRSIYPEEAFLGQMEKVRDGFVKGNAAFASLVDSLDGDRQAAARRELGLFRAIENHFSAVCDQIRFVRARVRGDKAEMRACARRELETAKRHLALVRADSRIGYECSNHYFYLPHDLIEKILCCRDVSDRLAVVENAAPADELARAKQKAVAEAPLAPPGYRRPADWKPVLYRKGLREIANDHSKEVMARAAKQMKKVDAVNAAGKWKATGASIDAHKCPEWFVDAKLGIFIDWGPWSIASWCPYVKGKRLYPDWYEYRCRTDKATIAYHEKNWGPDFKSDHLLDLFRGTKFDAPALMSVFKKCGAKYVVPFLKHHSGFCLWDCSYTFRDTVDMGAHRDFAREMANACRAEGLKFGLYASQAGEWEYPILQDDGSIKIAVNCPDNLQPYSPDMEWKASGKVAVKDFVRDYIVPQTTEFIDKYDPDIFWGDYDWMTPAESNGSYDIVAYLYNHAEGRKEVATNDRLGKARPEEIKGRFTKRPRTWLRTVRGDFYTDEWGDTEECLDPAKWHPWESCSGISKAYGNHWMENVDPGMVMDDRAFVIHFADIVARGGNLLLLVNLDPQGEIPAVQKERLLQIGQWLGRWGEAIYGTRILAPFNTKAIDYVQSKDGRFAYAIVKEPAAEVTLACALPEKAKVTVLGSNAPLATRRDGANTVVSVPAEFASSRLPFALKCTLK